MTQESDRLDTCPLPGVDFGAVVDMHDTLDAVDDTYSYEKLRASLPSALHSSRGLLVLKNMKRIANEPSMLVDLSRLFGSDIDNYRTNGTPERFVHGTMPQIFVVASASPVKRQPPPRPDPPTLPDGSLPVTFPHRRGWHADQSFRERPPDISLLYAVQVAEKGQGQTLFADTAAAYDSLPPQVRSQIDHLTAIHAVAGTGRTEDDVRNNRPVHPPAPHEAPQQHPVVRIHPVTNRRALYLCESEQMDWVDGPFVGMQPGPDGDGATLLYELMTHITQPKAVYVHDWDAGDLVIYDNRSIIHAATWFDATKHDRILWRTTVS